MSSILKKKKRKIAYLLCFLSLSMYNYIWLKSQIWNPLLGGAGPMPEAGVALGSLTLRAHSQSDPSQNKRSICPSPFLEKAQKQIPGNYRTAGFIPNSRNHSSKIIVNSKRTLIQMRDILTRKGKPYLSSSLTFFI